MVLTIPHFDPKLKISLDIKQTINNSLAEYLFKDTQFTVAAIDPDKNRPEDLKAWNDRTAQFANGKRIYFANKPVRNEVYPQPSDGAAYGSLLFTPCTQFQEITARVLVIDDSTGNTNTDPSQNLLPPQIAKNLVGDCHGKISLELAETFTRRQDTPFQFRLGIKTQANSPVARVAKGTLAPMSLDNISSEVTQISGKTKTQYDLILPTSAFKGRKGQQDRELQPGEYVFTLGIGVKSVANYGKHSLGTQILVNYPQGVQHEILPILQEKAEDLANTLADPTGYRLARHFVETYEKSLNSQQEDFSVRNNLTVEDNDISKRLDEMLAELDGEEYSRENPDDNRQLLTTYQLIKKQLETGNVELLEHPFIVNTLNQFVSKQYREIATGRAIKFDSGLAQPSLRLKENEICIPFLPEGEEIIVTRSPLVNSNGVIVLKNRHLREVARLKGCVHINPTTAAKDLQADFDGDRLAFALAKNYPILTEEIERALLSENRYAEVSKRDKQKYTGSFEQIALASAKNQIGTIANLIQQAVALRWETTLLPDSERVPYLNQVKTFYNKLLQRDADPNDFFTFSDRYRSDIEAIARLDRSPTILETERAFENIRHLQKLIVSDLSNELQIAVDGPKSAARPNEKILATCNAICSYREVDWLTDKKNPEVYLNRAMRSNNWSSIDLMVEIANQHYKAYRLQPRPSHHFRSFMGTPEPTFKDEAIAIRDKYTSYTNRAKEMDAALSRDNALRLPHYRATNENNKIIYITHLPENAQRDTAKLSEQFLRIKGASVFAIEQEGKLTKIGNLSPASYPIEANTFKTVSWEFNSGLNPLQVKDLLEQAKTFRQNLEIETPEDERTQIETALWHHTFIKNPDNPHKIGSVAFSIFSDRVLKRIETLNFDTFKLVGLDKDSNALKDRCWVDGETVSLEIKETIDPNSPLYGQRVVWADGKCWGVFEQDSPQLPIGSLAKATIKLPKSNAAIATSSLSNQLQIEKLSNYDFAIEQWLGQEVSLNIQSELPSKINMISAQGNQLSISLLKDTSIRQFVSDRLNQTSLITIKSVGQKGAAMAILEGKAIGWLDARSKTFLSAKNLRASSGKDFSLTLTTANPLKAIAYIQEQPIGILSTESKRKLEQKQLISSQATCLPKMQLKMAPVSWVTLEIDPSSLIYPWQRSDYSHHLNLETREQIALARTSIAIAEEIPMKEALWGNDEIKTTLDAMRLLGRSHTTRTYSPYKYHNLKKGDLAVAVGADGRKVAFEVGEQYRISESMVCDRAFQAQWSKQEKHSPNRLLALFEQQKAKWERGNRTGEPFLMGLQMKPLGDYVDGRILPLPSVQKPDKVQHQSRAITPKPNLVKPQIPTNALKEISQLPSQELVDLLEDVCLKEDLTSNSDRLFDSLSDADLKWMETTINKEIPISFHHIAVPSTRSGQDWEFFKDTCLVGGFDSLLEATKYLPGQHSHRLASLRVFQDQGDELFDTDQNLSFEIEDEFQEKIQEFVNCNDYISSKADKILQTQVVPLLGKRTLFQSGASPLPPSQIRLFERISHEANRDALAELCRLGIAPHQDNSISSPISQSAPVQEKSSAPFEIQLERTKTIAPIVKDYLDLANTHHHSGSVHTATWDKNSQILSLVDNRTKCLKLLAKLENNQWTVLPVPLTDSKSPNLTEADVTHFQSLVPKIEASWDKKRAQYRTWYSKTTFEILSSVKGSQPTPEQLDLAIAISVLAESDDRNDVSKVLSQSDTVLAMKTTLTPAQYQTQMTEYIERIYRQAVEKIQTFENGKNDLEQ